MGHGLTLYITAHVIAVTWTQTCRKSSAAVWPCPSSFVVSCVYSHRVPLGVNESRISKFARARKYEIRPLDYTHRTVVVSALPDTHSAGRMSAAGTETVTTVVEFSCTWVEPRKERVK